MDASSKIQRSIHDVRLTYKYVSRILGTYHLKQSIADFFDKFMESIFQEYLERSIKTYLRGDSGFSSQNFMKPVRVMAVSY